MNPLLVFLLALPQMAGRIAHSNSIAESTYTDVVKVPKSGKVRYSYPAYGPGKEYLIQPRCYDIRDEQTGAGPTQPTTDIDSKGFTVTAPAGHSIKITCRTMKATGPLA